MDCSQQIPPSVVFSRQEYWSGLPLPSPGDILHPGTEPGSPALQADALPSEPPGKSLFFLNKLSKAHKLSSQKQSSNYQVYQDKGAFQISLIHNLESGTWLAITPVKKETWKLGLKTQIL